jgi:hypothetical protein
VDATPISKPLACPSVRLPEVALSATLRKKIANKYAYFGLRKNTNGMRVFKWFVCMAMLYFVKRNESNQAKGETRLRDKLD